MPRPFPSISSNVRNSVTTHCPLLSYAGIKVKESDTRMERCIHSKANSTQHGSTLLISEMKQDGEKLPYSPPISNRTDQLRRATGLINSLIASSCSIRTFPAKWQLIRDKLERLNSGLAAATGGSSCQDDDSELVELLTATVSTVNRAQLLADRCADEAYDGGKLLLKSDIDMVTSRIDSHIKHLNEVYASGALTLSQAIILSKPGAGASREDMRFYVKDLFSRLRIGGLEMRARALAALNEILSEDDKYVRIAAMEIADGVGLLVSLLEHGDVGIQEEAARSVSVVASFESYRGALAMAGAVAALIRVLEGGSELAKERAGRALERLTQNSDNSWSVSAQGGVSTLLRICNDGEPSNELIASACGVLTNLSGVAEIRRFMLEEGVVAVFARLSRSKEEATQTQAIEFLSALASEDELVKERVVREGVVGSLVQVLEPNSSYSPKAREIALRAIQSLSFSSPNSVKILMGSGFLDRLLFLLRNGEVSVQESALKAASRLSGASEEARRAMGELGFMTELVRLLEARTSEVRQMAAESLCSLVSIQRNRRRFIQDDSNVDRILQLLDPEEEKKPAMARRFLLSTLMALTDSSSGRRKMGGSGYVKNLEKLAERDVIDAKKIVKKLSSSRFRTILHGIWRS